MLQELAKGNGLYRIRVPTRIGDEAGTETSYVSTFTKAVSTPHALIRLG